jgi:integrase
MTNWEQDPKVKKWFELIGNSRTVENYSREFPKYFDFVRETTKYKTPSQIIDARIEQTASKDMNERRQFEDIGKLFAHALNKTEYAFNTKKSYLRTMLSFFSKNHVRLEYSRGELFDILEHTARDKRQEWIPSNEEIRVIYRMANTSRDRAILLTLYQSGLSEVDVCSMQVEQFHFYDQNGNWSIPLNEDMYLSWFREKSDVPVQTCLSREALEEIRIMLQSRGFPKEGKLFLSVHGQPLDTRAVNDIMKAIVTKAFNGKSELWRTSHLRDAFMNGLEKAKVPSEMKDVFVGHTRLGAKKSYAVSEDTIKSLYSEAFKFLTINGYGSQSRKIEELEVKFTEQLTAMTEIMTELRTENKTLKQQLEENGRDMHKMTTSLEDLTARVETTEKRLKLKPKQKVRID